MPDAEVFDLDETRALIEAYRKHFGAVGNAVTTLQLFTGLSHEDADEVLVWVANDPHHEDADPSIETLSACTQRIVDFEMALMWECPREVPWAPPPELRGLLTSDERFVHRGFGGTGA